MSPFRKPLREIVPDRYYELSLVVIFVFGLITAYLTLRPINQDDWIRTAQNLRYMIRFEQQYDEVLGFQDADLQRIAQAEDIPYYTLKYSPWYMFYLGFLAFASAKLVLAFTVAAWTVIMLDIGYPYTVILFLHPIFVMLWAAANTDFLINGVGLWFVFLGVRGFRRGLALMLIAIKPQVLPLLLVLELARAVWERDWPALTTIGGLFAVSVALFPEWLPQIFSLADSSVSSSIGQTMGSPEPKAFRYSFSVFGAWGIWAALGITVVVLVLMHRRLTEWRTLAILLGLVWTPYVNPYSYAVLLILFRKTPLWRVVTYLAVSVAILPILFAEYHRYERYGMVVFLLLIILTVPDNEQTEEVIATRNRQPVFPPARWLVAGLARWHDTKLRVWRMT